MVFLIHREIFIASSENCIPDTVSNIGFVEECLLNRIGDWDT